ncbi:hypothetical protein ACM9NN_30430, partial [Pseudomonas paraeruginosa]|uniref:hypothetical protein n=1 Tax=Pseudomonas paraeruginosa TaxID=2994495 RepID=UPI003A4C6AD5
QAPQRLGSHPHVVAALASRNSPIADFWLRGASERQQLQAALSGREVLIVCLLYTSPSPRDHLLQRGCRHLRAKK